MRDFQAPGRSLVYAANGLCAASHPLAAQAAVRLMQDGGNAVDAAIGAAVLLGFCEPPMCGLGGDAFVLLKPAGEERLIADELLSARIRQVAGRDDPSAAREANTLPAALAALEKNMIYEGLKRNHWNKTKTAAELGISRRNLIRKVNSYKLDQRRARAS